MTKMTGLANTCSSAGFRLAIRLSGILLITLALSIPSTVLGQSAISLLRFTATGRTNNINIEWETATEFNNAGYYIWASLSENGAYNPISDFIPSMGDGVTGAMYGFVDFEVESGVTKFYKLEAIELNQESEFFGPISGVINLATQSPTITPTRSLTPTGSSSTSPTATPALATQAQNTTPAVTTPVGSYPLPTTPAGVTTGSSQSAYPGQASATMTSTPAFNSLGTPYLPLPSPTPQLAYPDQTVTPTSEAGENLATTPTQLTQVSPATSPAGGGTRTPQEVAGLRESDGVQIPPYTALLIVLLIWGLLAGWFYLSVRRLE